MASLPPLERGLRIIELVARSKHGVSWKEAHEHLDGVSTATTSKILKVLVEQHYLSHEGGLYQPGLKMVNIGSPTNCIERIHRIGEGWAEAASTVIGASTVIALLQDAGVEFVGSSVLEGSLAFSGKGTAFPYTNVHILTQIHHVRCRPDDVKRQFDSGILSYEPQGKNPGWATYVEAIVNGLNTGAFCEYSWKFMFFYRIAVPLFSASGELIAALMTGFKTRELLDENKQRILDYAINLNIRFNGNENSFKEGMAQLRRQGASWLNL